MNENPSQEQNLNPPADQEVRPPANAPKVFFEWVTLAYRQTEKSKGWYAVMGIIVLLFVLYGMFSSDSSSWVVSVTFLVMAGVYYFSEMKPAPTVRVMVTELGIRYGNKFFPYNQIKSFWLLIDQNHRELFITPHREREQDIMIAPEVNVARLREYLLTQITEEEGRKERFLISLFVT